MTVESPWFSSVIVAERVRGVEAHEAGERRELANLDNAGVFSPDDPHRYRDLIGGLARITEATIRPRKKN